MENKPQELIKQVVDAIEFYADEDNYKSTEVGMPCCLWADRGDRARETLTAMKELQEWVEKKDNYKSTFVAPERNYYKQED